MIGGDCKSYNSIVISEMGLLEQLSETVGLKNVNRHYSDLTSDE